jgi:putative phage-type endonuclease
MKQINLEQGSDGWKQWRNKGIGSSEIGTILGVNPYQNVHNLWMIKTNQKPAEDLSKNFFVQRGSQLEPMARDIFNERTDSHFIPATFVHQEFEFMKFSADGVDFDKNEIIEIKSMMAKNHQKVIDTNKPSESYYAQMQWGLLITEAKICHFIAYNPEFPNPMHVIKIHPDELAFKSMKNAAHWFWHCVTEMKSPDDYTFEKFSIDNPGLICT